MKTHPRLTIVSGLAALQLFCGACQSRFGSSKSAEAPQDAEPHAYVVRLDGPTVAPPASAGRTPAREFGFEVAGFADAPSDASAEQLRTVMQAAVIEALGRALVEARRSRGQPTEDFSARIGPRLTISRKPLEYGCEYEVILVARGEETRFVVRNGVLQHQPHDFNTLQKVFDETNGEFVLLSADRTLSGDVCEARIACYRPAGYDSALAGDARQEDQVSP